VGRPTSLIEEVERELKGKGVKDWKRLALERDKWDVEPRQETFE
jgi:hypothetical protein